MEDTAIREVDVIVIGAGPAGEVCAGRLGQAGLEVVIVERELVGGECSFWGCMPSKALLRPAQLLAEVARVPGAREAAVGQLDVAAVLRRRDQVISGLDDAGQLPWLVERSVELLRGHGRLAGERTVEVAERRYRARRAVVLAPGSAAAIPPIPGLAGAAWTNREITTAQAVPRRLLVLGGGVIGVEMAQAWASLGSRVTIVEALPRLLAREEPFASELVTTALVEAGVDVRTGVAAASAARIGSEVALDLADGSRVAADALLVAVGRHALVSDLGLDSVGVEAGGLLAVDDSLRVDGHDWLFAIGDVNGRAQLTHAGKYQARLVADGILDTLPASVERRLDPLADGPLTPRVVFTDPQVAAVGHTEESASSAGLRVVAAEIGVSANAGASFHGRGTPGRAQVLADPDRGVLVGATFVGYEVAEMLHAATIAIVGEVPLSRLLHAVPAFPTRSELWLRLVDQLVTATASVRSVRAA